MLNYLIQFSTFVRMLFVKNFNLTGIHVLDIYTVYVLNIYFKFKAHTTFVRYKLLFFTPVKTITCQNYFPNHVTHTTYTNLYLLRSLFIIRTTSFEIKCYFPWLLLLNLLYPTCCNWTITWWKTMPDLWLITNSTLLCWTSYVNSWFYIKCHMFT